MIYFTDRTINECEGHYVTITSLMRDEEGVFSWMLKSLATVSSMDLLGGISIACNYALHFYSNGDVYVMSTDHPQILDVPDDDLRELKKWSIDHGWKRLCVNKLLLEDPIGFQFWLRMYISGLIYSDILEKHEASEMSRLSHHIEEDEDEDDRGENYGN